MNEWMNLLHLDAAIKILVIHMWDAFLKVNTTFFKAYTHSFMLFAIQLFLEAQVLQMHALILHKITKHGT